MKYIQHINARIGAQTRETPGLVLFGQNIAAGSHLSGLTKGLAVGHGGTILNTTNAENTLTGIGFGLMLEGVSSIFFVKQLDFLLLGVDQLVDTYNFIRRKEPRASYTIVPIVSDLGYHGVQSSFNNLGDIASVARIPAYTITNTADADAIISRHLIAPGFRIIAVAQRLFGAELTEREAVSNEDQTLFTYTSGDAATIACFNFSFSYGEALHAKLAERNASAALFSVNSVTPTGWEPLLKSLEKTGKLVLFDDSKSENRSCDHFLAAAYKRFPNVEVIRVERTYDGASWLFPNPDTLAVDYEALIGRILE